MAYQVLARKWRPKKFQDVVGQAHVTRSLQNAILKEKLGHAYILSGTRGIGKTSIARLFAKAIRCENRLPDANPCGTCPSCLDFDTGNSMNVIEIDGASNNSVDNIRDRIDNVQYVPTSGQHKIYVIDEVHMLSTSAFNALLKTLEEPPGHVVFIFATTEPEKLIGTVLSRCQRFDFRHLSLKDLEDHIKRIAQAEGITFQNDKLLKQICVQGKGSVRDTLSLLDQVLSYTTDNNITEETIVTALGLARASTIRFILDTILQGDAPALSRAYRGLLAENISAKNILTSLLDQIFEVIEHVDHADYLNKNDLVTPELLAPISTPELFWIYETLAKDATWVLGTLTPDKVTEITLQKLALRRNFFSAKAPSKNITDGDVKKKLSPEPQTVSPPVSSPEPKIEIPAPLPQAPIQEEEPPMPELEPILLPSEPLVELPEPVIVSPPSKVEVGEKTWESFLKHLSKKSQMLTLNLDQGNILSPIIYDGKKLIIDLAFDSKGKFSYECLIEKDQLDRLYDSLSDFFSVTKANIELSLKLLTGEQKTQFKFYSRAELDQQTRESHLNRKKEYLLQHPNIVDTEKIFNSKVDKVIVKNS